MSIHMIYDVIPDIHGDMARLERTLSALGYSAREASSGPTWQPPAGHRAIFLGDFIDGGTRNRDVLTTVRAMVDAGTALAVMGNHELNAILFHTPGKAWGNRQDGWMRAHTGKNRQQHASFLREYPQDDEERRDMINWFMRLPLALDVGTLRIVHACWSERSLSIVRDRRPDLRLQPGDLQEIALEQTDFARAVATLLKGPETDLPDGIGFRDFHGSSRRQMRIRWWQETAAATWRSAALSVPDPLELPDTPIAASLDIEFYPQQAARVIFGHYKMLGEPAHVDATARCICLDWPHAPLAWTSRNGGEIVRA